MELLLGGNTMSFFDCGRKGANEHESEHKHDNKRRKVAGVKEKEEKGKGKVISGMNAYAEILRQRWCNIL